MFINNKYRHTVTSQFCRMVSPAAGWRLVSAACLVWPSLAQPAACSTHCSHCRPELLQFLDIESHKSGIRRSRHRHPGPQNAIYLKVGTLTITSFPGILTCQPVRLEKTFEFVGDTSTNLTSSVVSFRCNILGTPGRYKTKQLFLFLHISLTLFYLFVFTHKLSLSLSLSFSLTHTHSLSLFLFLLNLPYKTLPIHKVKHV